jgi:hypothetical protein
MTGQWVSGGGLPAVAPAARGLVKSLCKRDRRPFVTSIATHLPMQSGDVLLESACLRNADRPIEEPVGPARDARAGSSP